MCQSLLLPNTSIHPLDSHPSPLSFLSSFVITLLFSTSFLPMHCVKPPFGTPPSETNLWFSPLSSLSKYRFHLPMILSRFLKTTHCSSFIWLLLVKSLALAIRYIFLSPSGISSYLYNSLWLRYCFLCRLVCLYIAISAFLMFPTSSLPYLINAIARSGRFHLVWYQNRPQLQTGKFPFMRRVSSQWPRFHRLRDGQKLPKIVYGESVLKKLRKWKWLARFFIRPEKNKLNFFFFKLPARLLVRPWPDQPDRLLRPWTIMWSRIQLMTFCKRDPTILCIVMVALMNTETQIQCIRFHTFEYWTKKNTSSVFCPGFQKGRVPSEKGTLARWTDR